MPIVNGYATLAELKASLAIATADVVDDTALEAAITSASRMIDNYTQRFFYKDGTSIVPVSRFFTANDSYSLSTDDIVSINEVATDDSLAFTYTTVWATTDYIKEPVNNPRRDWPWTRLIAVDRYKFPYHIPQAVRIKAVWGFTAVPSEINMATLIQSSRLFVRRQSPFGIAGSPDLGTVRLSARLDPDVVVLAQPFRKNQGLVT